MQTITLTAASGIQRSADVYTSKAGPDVGSTYFRFTCASCQNPLGRYYLTTSKDLDNLREKFTFTIESITSYELGKPQHGKIIFTDLETGISDSPAKDDENRVFPDGKSGDLDLSLLSVKEELSQVGIYALLVVHLHTF